MSGPLRLKLNCIVLGNNPRHIFPVDIERTEIVGDLKEVIKDKKRPEFDHVATDRLELWKVDLPINEMIEHNLNNLTLDPTKSLSPVDEMVEIFPDAPPRKYLHIIIQCPPAVSSGPLHLKLNCIVFGDDPCHIFPVDVERMKTVGDLKNVIKVAKKPEFDHVAADRLELWKVKINLNNIQLRNAIMDGAVDRRITYLKKGAGTPSASAKPSAFSTKQDQQEYLCNRPRRAADPVPITLLEPIFAEFVDDCQKYEPTVHDNDFVLQLSEKMASFYPNELTWMNTFWQVLRDYGIILNASMVGSTGCTTDGHLLSTNRQFVLMIIEGKNEIGSGAAKPFMEAMLYYHKFMEDSKIEMARLRSFIPCIHIIVFGACIGFSGSVFTEKSNLHMQVMAARTFGALKIAVEKLTKLYSRPILSLEPEDPYLKCPYPQSYTNSTGFIQEFRYDETQILRDRLIFFGETVGDAAGSKICIKFVRHYSPQAHEFCASKGNTPKLIAYNSLPGSWNLVIMDALDIDNDCLPQRPGSYRLLSEIGVLDRQPLKETITCLIRELHNHNDGYVHGDLRDTNFVVRDDKHFMLLDFDWARPIQKTHYPMYVNRKDIRRPDGAWDGQKIVVEHDLDMLNYLFHPEQDVREPAAKRRRILSEGSLMVI
ncbi:uncharacterized protein F5891DRAFT_1187269 [Suillus fuscotomentosus]|uniref:Crinkler effector protein N-terminal domain-containing protein n=1 Tax=Suillus fuscotomentosus TaxID=1912939 RepID=A0AAD4E8T5_9AGAM|nr:uncharacterized protein F5891DRAFT_1187269 [Suillus fuscotomentosus]KAG1901794.1 hypothetical protein F5891DRAFT_1187269 [Suillus fuscotomentosus]